jgi:hypothetical protein
LLRPGREIFLKIFLKSFLEIIFSVGKIFKKILCGLAELFLLRGRGVHENIFVEAGGGYAKIFFAEGVGLCFDWREPAGSRVRRGCRIAEQARGARPADV